MESRLLDGVLADLGAESGAPLQRALHVVPEPNAPIWGRGRGFLGEQKLGEIGDRYLGCPVSFFFFFSGSSAKSD